MRACVRVCVCVCMCVCVCVNRILHWPLWVDMCVYVCVKRGLALIIMDWYAIKKHNQTK